MSDIELPKKLCESQRNSYAKDFLLSLERSKALHFIWLEAFESGELNFSTMQYSEYRALLICYENFKRTERRGL